MASEVRVNKLTNRSGLGTATFNDDGSIAFAGNLTLNNITTAARNAGVSTAIGAMIFNTSLNQMEVYTPAGWVAGAQEPFSATGGTEDTTSRSGYVVHTFTSPGTFAASGSPKIVEYLVIAGGGSGGGTYHGAGGGAGGMRSGTVEIAPGNHTVTVGAGGAGMSPYPNGVQSPGSDSVFSTITSTGGGGGAGGGAYREGDPGGSGGGAGYQPPATGGAGNAGGHSPPEGNPGGGAGHNPNYGSGGGGGAGGSGSSGTPTTGGAGGPGASSSISGTAVTYAGGGGGSTFNGGTPGNGGPGGGGNASRSQGTAGSTNTGSGGGGSERLSGFVPGGAGGSGIVIVAYSVT